MFRKYDEKIQVSLESDENNRYFDEDQSTFVIYHRILLRMRNVWDESCRENQNTYFVCINFFYQKSYHLWDNVEKYCRAGQATYESKYSECVLYAG